METIRTLHQTGMSLRQISKHLKIARNTVRSALRKGRVSPENDPTVIPQQLLEELFKTCRGNAVRIHDMLQEHHQINLGYSTLTQIIREAHLRKPKRRVGRYVREPGEESQHDTSPHRLTIAGKEVRAECAALILAYSRMAFVQYFPRFTRFEAEWFLSQAHAFFEGACQRCVVDNTSVLVASGSGAEAVFAPEMVSFGACYGVEFLAHEIGHADRKAYVERLFSYVENNFLAGRQFESWQDLNRQVRAWCINVANAKPKRSLGMSPRAAFVIEKPRLQPLPRHLPPVYRVVSRVVDCYGYVHLDTKRYSVPQRLIGKRVEVHKHPETVMVYFRDKCVAEHARCLGRGGNERITAPHHHQAIIKRSSSQKSRQEQQLRGLHQVLDRYVDELKQRAPGRGVRQFNRLINLKRTYPQAAFIAGLEHALNYGLFDLARLERLIIERVAGDFFKIDPEEE